MFKIIDKIINIGSGNFGRVFIEMVKIVVIININGLFNSCVMIFCFILLLLLFMWVMIKLVLIVINNVGIWVIRLLLMVSMV